MNGLFQIFQSFDPLLLVGVGVALVVLASVRFQIHKRRITNVKRVSLEEAQRGGARGGAGSEGGAVRGLVQVSGIVAAGEGGHVTAPLSGKSCVWVRITVDAEMGPAGARWRNVAQEIEHKDFALRDASGAHSAVVQPGRAEVRSNVCTTSTIDATDVAPAGALVDYVVAQGSTIEEIRSFMSEPGAIRAIEECLVVGDLVHLVGRVERPDEASLLFRGSPMYVAHEDVALLAKDGRLFDGRPKP